jgi:hypothetical protein
VKIWKSFGVSWKIAEARDLPGRPRASAGLGLKSRALDQPRTQRRPAEADRFAGNGFNCRAGHGGGL